MFIKNLWLKFFIKVIYIHSFLIGQISMLKNIIVNQLIIININPLKAMMKL